MITHEYQMLCAVLASGGQIVIDEQHKTDANFHRLQIDQRENTGETVLMAFSMSRADYGRCPHCHAICVERERRLGGNDKCENGHVYPSSAAMEPGK